MFTEATAHFSNMDPFSKGNIWYHHTFLILLAVKSWANDITLRTSAHPFEEIVQLNLPENPVNVILLGFLGKENDSHLLEIDQVAPGSSLGRATAKLGWSLKGARVETQRAWVPDYAVQSPTSQAANHQLRNVAQVGPASDGNRGEKTRKKKYR